MGLKGKITQENIDELKQAFPDMPLYRWHTLDKKNDIVYTSLSKDTYDEISAEIARRAGKYQTEDELKEDVNMMIFGSCIVWPELSVDDLGLLPVGVIPSVSKSIQEQSGFITVDIYGNIISKDLTVTQIKGFDHWDNITKDEIDDLKSKCTYPLYLLKTMGYQFVVRPILRDDVATAGLSDDLNVIKSVVLWPVIVPWGKLPAGVLENIKEQCNLLSGWNLESVEIEEL